LRLTRNKCVQQQKQPKGNHQTADNRNNVSHSF
jgi:hypothetical protein